MRLYTQCINVSLSTSHVQKELRPLSILFLTLQSLSPALTYKVVGEYMRAEYQRVSYNVCSCPFPECAMDWLWICYEAVHGLLYPKRSRSQRSIKWECSIVGWIEAMARGSHCHPGQPLRLIDRKHSACGIHWKPQMRHSIWGAFKSM